MFTTETKNKNVSMFHFMDPVDVIVQMDVNPGSVVADFGCGSGFFSIPLASVVGEEGKVYAIDVLPQALESVSSRAKILGITNIIPKRLNVENVNGSQLEGESMDWVIMKDMLHQNKNKEAIIDEAYRILRPAGKALIVEWKKEKSIIGPEVEARLDANEILDLLKRKRFVVNNIIKVGNFHYGIIVKK